MRKTIELIWVVIALGAGQSSGLCQGHLVPDGVVSNYQGLGFAGEIDVLHNPAMPGDGGSYSAFLLRPFSATSFRFEPIGDIGVRVFVVSPNDPVSLDAVVGGRYQELVFPNMYTVEDGVPFYVGLYTGNVRTYPVNGIYDDPLFGWARLVNYGGTISFLGGALEYKGGGILAGTQTIIPEPGAVALALAGLSIMVCRRHKRWARFL